MGLYSKKGRLRLRFIIIFSGGGGGGWGGGRVLSEILQLTII